MSTLPITSPERRTVRDEVVRVSSLAVTTDVVSNIDFVNCELVGPAVVSPMGCTFSGTTFEGIPEALVQEVKEGSPVLIGTIVMIECTFVNSRFRRVGFTATRDFVDAFLKIPHSGELEVEEAGGDGEREGA